MATPELNLSTLANGQNQPEVPVNNSFSYIEKLFGQPLVKDLDGASPAVALTSGGATTEFDRNLFFQFDDGAAPSGTAAVTVPAIERGLFVVFNNSSIPLTVEISGQSEPAVAVGSATLVLCVTDGANVRGVSSAAPAMDDLTDVTITTAAAGHMLRYNGAAWVNEVSPYDLSMFLPATYSAGALMAQIVFDRAVTFPDDFAGSELFAGTAATGSTVLDIHKNGSPIGTITVGAAGTTGTFATSGGATSFAAGDRLAIVNENPADATLADLSITLKGTRD